MSKYIFGMFLSLKKLKIYKSNIYIGLFSGAVYLISIFSIWNCIYKEYNNVAGLDENTIYLYYILSWFVSTIVSTKIDREVSDSIKNGEIINDLIKPIDYFTSKLFNSFGVSLFNFLHKALPLIIVTFIIMKIKIDKIILLIPFSISIFFGIIINAEISYLTGVIGFWSISARGAIHFKEVIQKNFSGALVPLTFFPDSIQKISNILPFDKIIYYPVSILTTRGSYVNCIGIQFSWCFLLFIIIKIVFNNGINKLTVQGG